MLHGSSACRCSKSHHRSRGRDHVLRAREGRDSIMPAGSSNTFRFNPRAREGRDLAIVTPSSPWVCAPQPANHDAPSRRMADMNKQARKNCDKSMRCMSANLTRVCRTLQVRVSTPADLSCPPQALRQHVPPWLPSGNPDDRSAGCRPADQSIRTAVVARPPTGQVRLRFRRRNTGRAGRSRGTPWRHVAGALDRRWSSC